MTVALTALLAMTSLAVDVGVFFTAKMELQRAADAAALAAAEELRQGGSSADVTAQAFQFASANLVAGEALTGSGISVSLGSYADGNFVNGMTPVQAVRVVLKRTQATGHPIALHFARFLGVTSVDVTATSTARARLCSPYNLVGINRASFSSIGVLASIDGRIVSNGDVSIGYPLGLLVGVQGEARSWNGAVRKGVLAGITGSTSRLDQRLTYPSVALPSSNDNGQISSYMSGGGDLNLLAIASIPAGTYVVRDFNLVAGAAIRLEGPVTVYVTRNFNLAAAVNLLGNTSFDPSKFCVRVLPGGGVNFLAPILVPLRMDLYAPDSDINIAVAVTGFKGRIIGRTLDIALPALGSFTEDKSLGDPVSDLQQVVSLAK